MKYTKLHLAVAISLFLGACTDEVPPLDKNEEYTREFIKQFGLFDTSNDWNTAGVYTARIDRSCAAEAARVLVYTDRPGTPGCMLVADYPATASEFRFDMEKTAGHVFVELRDKQNRVVADGYRALAAGSLKIEKNSLADTETTPESCPVTIASTIKENNVVSANIKNFPDDVKEEWRILLGDERYNEAIGGDGTVKATEIFKTYILSGKETSPGKQWSLGYVSTIVGKEGKFLENVCNVSKFRDKLHPERGVEYVLEEDGPIQISYFWGGTAYFNKLGYLYYKEGATLEEIMHAPRFILIDDARPQKNIKGGNDPDTPGTIEFTDGMQLPTNLNFYEQGLTWMPQYVTGTRHNLVYFGEGTEHEIGKQGSYTFPAGTHVAFFVIKHIGENSEEKEVPWKRSYSLPKLNWVMNYKTTHGDNCSVPGEYPSEDFVTYLWNGYTVMGIEDGVDHDANDMMFYVYANIADEDIPVVEEQVEPESQSWILAMEDLGNNDDFDFNDLVVKISHVAGSRKLTVEPLAAGGELPARLYFRDAADPVGHDKGFLHINEFFGESDHSILINTRELTHTGQAVELEVEEGFTMSSDPLTVENNRMGGFYVRVQQDKASATDWTQDIWDIEPSKPGTVPQMLCVPASWAWPRERENIRDAYPEINEWIKDRNTNTDWYKHPVESRVVKRK